jgi:hypothetical protein
VVDETGLLGRYDAVLRPERRLKLPLLPLGLAPGGDGGPAASACFRLSPAPASKFSPARRALGRAYNVKGSQPNAARYPPPLRPLCNGVRYEQQACVHDAVIGALHT